MGQPKFGSALKSGRCAVFANVRPLKLCLPAPTPMDATHFRLLLRISLAHKGRRHLRQLSTIRRTTVNKDQVSGKVEQAVGR